MPIPVVARQSRCIEADHQTRVAEPDLGDEPLEPPRSTLPFPNFPRSSSMTTTQSGGQPI